MVEYLIHNNGGRPFKVVIDEKLKIYKQINDFGQPLAYSENASLEYTPKEIFIGGETKEDEGNSILLNLDKLEYVFIGEYIFSFTAQNKIKKYFSPMGNSDVPFPYAIDEKNKVYLLVEDTIFETKVENKGTFVYIDFYNKTLMSDDSVSTPIRKSPIKNFHGITNYYIEDLNGDGDSNWCARWTNTLRNCEIASYKTIDGSINSLSKEEFEVLKDEFGKLMGLEKLDSKEII